MERPYTHRESLYAPSHLSTGEEIQRPGFEERARKDAGGDCRVLREELHPRLRHGPHMGRKHGQQSRPVHISAGGFVCDQLPAPRSICAVGYPLFTQKALHYADLR